MDEFIVVIKARTLVARVTPHTIPVPLDPYLAHVGAVVRHHHRLAQDEHTGNVGGKRCIVVNGSDPAERQRFTVCHELGHIVLKLPRKHDTVTPEWNLTNRPATEVLCDIFAAELLLAFPLFKPLVDDTDFGFAGIDNLAARFVASRTATGTRFAAVCGRPCAFVLAQQGVVQYVSRSISMRRLKAWVRPGVRLPQSSLAAHLCNSAIEAGPIALAAADWFDGWSRGGFVMEDARRLPRWEQTLSLLWFAAAEVPPSVEDQHEEAKDPASN